MEAEEKKEEIEVSFELKRSTRERLDSLLRGWLYGIPADKREGFYASYYLKLYGFAAPNSLLPSFRRTDATVYKRYFGKAIGEAEAKEVFSILEFFVSQVERFRKEKAKDYSSRYDVSSSLDVTKEINKIFKDEEERYRLSSGKVALLGRNGTILEAFPHPCARDFFDRAARLLEERGDWLCMKKAFEESLGGLRAVTRFIANDKDVHPGEAMSYLSKLECYVPDNISAPYKAAFSPYQGFFSLVGLDYLQAKLAYDMCFAYASYILGVYDKKRMRDGWPSIFGEDHELYEEKPKAEVPMPKGVEPSVKKVETVPEEESLLPKGVTLIVCEGKRKKK